MSKGKKLTPIQKKELDKKAEQYAIEFRKKLNLGDEPVSAPYWVSFTFPA